MGDMELPKMLADVDDIKFLIERLLPPELVAAMHDADVVLTLSPSTDHDTIVTISEELAERELIGDMVNYRKRTTGVENTIFISQRGYAKHAARIKVAVDPDSLNVLSKQASIELSTGKVVAGESPSAEVLKQIKKFIELNRNTLIDYWESRISTEELQELLKAVSED
jgi:hypothetical protein